MKKILLFIVVLLFLILCCSAEGKPVKVEKPDTNENYDFCVVFLFEVEGCKIYRFLDGGYYHYFMIGSGQVINTVQEKTVSTGKTTITYRWDDASIIKE